MQFILLETKITSLLDLICRHWLGVPGSPTSWPVGEGQQTDTSGSGTVARDSVWTL